MNGSREVGSHIDGCACCQQARSLGAVKDKRIAELEDALRDIRTAISQNDDRTCRETVIDVSEILNAAGGYRPSAAGINA